jgi:DNA-binding transcriptional ArsR family regulator
MSRPQASNDVFYAIADPTRRAILQRLAGGELAVSTLAGEFPTTLSAVSQHIRVLKEAGLVTMRKSGRERYYQLNPRPLKAVSDWVEIYQPFWAGKLDALGAYLEETDE